MSSVSFEYFPPRSDKARQVLLETIAVLSEFQPEFQSVTYGAGGSSVNGTLETLVDIVDRPGFPVASHLTYAGSTKDEIRRFADLIWKEGVQDIVALRGDGEASACAFETTAQFITVVFVL